MSLLAISLPGGIALGVGAILVIAILSLGVSFFWSTLFLWLGTKVACVKNTTFGRAMKCNAIIWLLTGVLVVAFLAVLWFQIGSFSLRTPLIVLIAACLAVAGYAAITISFIMSGFEVSLVKSIGVWAATIGLNVLVVFTIEFVLWVAMLGPVAYTVPEWLPVKMFSASAGTDRPEADKDGASGRLAAAEAPSVASPATARGADPALAGGRAATRPAPAKSARKASASRAGPDNGM
jgi:hypothetical protein